MAALSQFQAIRLKRETIPNTLEVMGNADFIYAEDVEVGEDTQEVSRPGTTFARAGWAALAGMKNPSFGFKLDVTGISLGDLVDLANLSSAPWEDLLHSSGFALVTQTPATGTGTALKVWELSRTGASPFSMEVFTPDGAGNFAKRTMIGCLTSIEIGAEAGQRLSLEVTDGKARSFDYTTVTTTFTPNYGDNGRIHAGSGVFAADARFRDPFMCMGVSASLSYEDRAAATTRSYTGALTNLRVKIDNGLEYQPDMKAVSGVGGISFAPPAPPRIMFTVEAPTSGSFNVYSARNNRSIVSLAVEFTALDSVADHTDTQLHEINFVIVKVTPKSNDAGRLMFEIEGELQFPDTALPQSTPSMYRITQSTVNTVA